MLIQYDFHAYLFCQKICNAEKFTQLCMPENWHINHIGHKTGYLLTEILTYYKSQ